MSLQKIEISPESEHHGDNDDNVAYLYRGYIIWKETWLNVGERGGSRDEWNYAPAVLRTPIEGHENFEPYWDDNGNVETCDSRRECITCIDRKTSFLKS